MIAYSPSLAGSGTATLVLATNDGLRPTLPVPLSARARDVLPCQVRLLPGKFPRGISGWSVRGLGAGEIDGLATDSSDAA